ncbi:cytochrome ubiquinol oxidase subunit I [Solirubrobacter soli]|uniref:cytochrome ubiquinol oxidase subunit I n=1 Tax=Solirubrobacter soli TaxID=363832 RepID=UPI00040B4443|nr:cytochrome ubiquinol oxidase subunit I [Solirubrobacter soli]
MNVDLARVQFGLTSIYHFLFVPVTMGLAFSVAVLQTLWHRSGAAEWLRLTRFFGTLLLINVAVGVATGLVQEFQFGMNWSAYSRYVGDVFGGPLAMEGLAAFFLESTFLGLWVFGWGRLGRRAHLFCIWMVALGSYLSAAFIMAANSWMQHPVGYAAGDPPRLNDIGALFTNPVFVWAYFHVVLAALATGALVVLSVSAWHIRRGHEAFAKSAALAISVLVPVSIALILVGSQLGVIETRYQPMKIAAAEAQWDTCQPCSFSAFQIRGGAKDEEPQKVIAIPHLLSLLATLSWNGEVQGLNELQSSYEQQYGPGDYVPNVFVQYWSMRVMAYLATAVMALSLWGAWLLHRRRLATSKWFLRAAVWAVFTPFLMNTAGWMLTENGRQPWIVQGLMKTADGVSPSVSVTWIWISLGAFALLYLVLAVVDLVLMLRFARREPTAASPEQQTTLPALTY